MTIKADAAGRGYRHRTERGFSLVEILITFAIMVVLYFAAYFTFINSYNAQDSTSKKMHNIHAAATILEFLRHELTALPDFKNIDDKFIAQAVSDSVTFEKTEYGKDKGTTYNYYLDKEKKMIVRTINGAPTEFGDGRILEFTFTHNINKEKPNFPTWIKVRIKTINDNKSEVELEGTFFPRLINRNIQLEQTF